MNKKGVLITFEGNEGCGKSTQIKLLYEYFQQQGRRVFLTREPGGTGVSDGIRAVLLDNKNKRMTALTETLLYMASRAQLVEEVIKPRLERGEVVLCDRWLDATLAYQGYGGGVDKKWIEGLGKTATQGIQPALTLFLDLPLKIGLRRALSRKKADRVESKNIHYHEKVRKGYLAIAKKEPRRFRPVRIREKDSIWAVHEKIKKMIQNALSKNK